MEVHAIETTTATGEDTGLDRRRGAGTGTVRDLQIEGIEIATAIGTEGTDPGIEDRDIMMIEEIGGEMMMMDLGIVVMTKEIDEVCRSHPLINTLN